MSAEIEVRVRDGDVEGAMRVLRRKISRAGTLRTYRDKQYFTKPSKEKRLAKESAMRRIKRNQRRRKKRRGY